MNRIVDQLLQLAKFIETRKIDESDIVNAGVGYSASLHLSCEAFIAVTNGSDVTLSEFGHTCHGHGCVDGIPIVCVADNEQELQRLRSVGKVKPSFPVIDDEMPF